MSGSIKSRLALPAIDARLPSEISKRNHQALADAHRKPALKPRAGSKSDSIHLSAPAAAIAPMVSQLAWAEPVLRPEKGVLGLNLGLRRLESFLAEIHTPDDPDPLTRAK